MTYFMEMITRIAPNRRYIAVSQAIWRDTWGGLRQRGGGQVETAAVWAGKRLGSDDVVEAIYFLDDIAGGFGEEGYHYTPTANLAALFNQLRHDKRVIIADIHTHPGEWVGLSDIDKSLSEKSFL